MLQLARPAALYLYHNMAVRFGQSSFLWMDTEGMADVLGRLALPYSLRQLSGWLSRGGMALGAPPTVCLPCL